MPKYNNRLAHLRRKMPDVIGDPHGVHRFVALVFEFYRRCANGPCRRTKNCVGEGAPCFDAFWWDLPNIQKDIYREHVRACVGGARTPEEIERVAFEKIMTYYTPEQIHEAAAQAEKDRW